MLVWIIHLFRNSRVVIWWRQIRHKNSVVLIVGVLLSKTEFWCQNCHTHIRSQNLRVAAHWFFLLLVRIQDCCLKVPLLFTLMQTSLRLVLDHIFLSLLSPVALIIGRSELTIPHFYCRGELGLRQSSFRYPHFYSY